MLILIALVFSVAGLLVLNQDGSYTRKTNKQALGYLLNFVSVILFALEYGTARGIFIYLAVIALVGILINGVRSTKKL